MVFHAADIQGVSCTDKSQEGENGSAVVVVAVVVVVFTLKTVLTSIQYPSLPYASRQRNEFPWSQANPK